MSFYRTGYYYLDEPAKQASDRGKIVLCVSGTSNSYLIFMASGLKFAHTFFILMARGLKFCKYIFCINVKKVTEQIFEILFQG